MTASSAPRRALIRRAVPAFAIATALLAGCTSGGGGGDVAASRSASPQASSGTGSAAPGTTTPTAPSSPPPKGQDDPALKDFYAQQLAWKACEDDADTREKDEAEFQCAKLRVPLDYANPSARSIDIAVMRHPAARREGRIGSLLTNPGGPGGSGIEWLKYAYDSFDGEMHERFDVIGFDPRGVGASAPVLCFDDKTRDRINAEDGPDPKNIAAYDAFVDQQGKEFAEACQAKAGALLPFIGTRNVARDMDVLRAALGDAELNYLGYSYGTYLGSLYIEEFPDKVGRLVLDGAVDPAADPLDESVGQQIGFEKAFTRFAEDCAKRPGCPLGRDAAKAAQVGVDFLNGLRTSPLPTREKGRKLTSSLGWTGAIDLLYGDAQAWQWLREALTLAMRNGDGSALLFYADSYNGREEDGRYDGSMDAFPAILCADSAAPAPSPERIQQVLDKLRREAPLFSRDTVAEDFDDPGCEFWPYKTPEKPHTVSAPADSPVLVIGTTGDPATPYAASERLAEGLGNATLLTLEGEGHTAYGKGNNCIDAAVNRYFVEGTMPPAATRCVQ